MGYFVPSSHHQVRSHGCLFVVADGVGGHDFGEVASSRAVSVLLDEYEKAQSGAVLISLLPRLVQSANAAVHDLGLAPEYRGKQMATTVVALALRHDQAVVSHVGDSRCYLIRGGRARQITEDHTWVNEQRKLGLISDSEMDEAEMRHVLSRSLGPQLHIKPDSVALTVQAGDIFVLCTDGLHDRMSAEQMAAIAIRHRNMEDAARELVERALELDGNDNITAQVVRVRSVEQVGMYRGRTYRLSS